VKQVEERERGEVEDAGEGGGEGRPHQPNLLHADEEGVNGQGNALVLPVVVLEPRVAGSGPALPLLSTPHRDAGRGGHASRPNFLCPLSSPGAGEVKVGYAPPLASGGGVRVLCVLGGGEAGGGGVVCACERERECVSVCVYVCFTERGG